MRNSWGPEILVTFYDFYLIFFVLDTAIQSENGGTNGVR